MNNFMKMVINLAQNSTVFELVIFSSKNILEFASFLFRFSKTKA